MQNPLDLDPKAVYDSDRRGSTGFLFGEPNFSYPPPVKIWRQEEDSKGAPQNAPNRRIRFAGRVADRRPIGLRRRVLAGEPIATGTVSGKIEPSPIFYS